MEIFYGTMEKMIDVTNVCLQKLLVDNIITIPNGDSERACYFTDPLIGVLKSVFIKRERSLTEYKDFELIKINIIDNSVNIIDYNYINDCVNSKLANIHSNLKINYGDLNGELPEQKMAVRYLCGNEKVLEIGGNIGRNSLVISSILKNSSNLVTLESDSEISQQLIENRDLNNLNFHIESLALSNRKLIQTGWDTIPSDVLLDGYKWVNTITLDELNRKYNIEFDTLVLDCEGAFYYILMDMPEILNGINLIIMENDYHDISKKKYVDDVLIKNNFVVDYKESGGWGPCYNNFFEVWKRR